MALINQSGPACETVMVKVEDPKNIPPGKHYAIMVYTPETRSEYEAPWHERDRGVGTYRTTSYVDVQHWVTTNKEIWQKHILQMERGESRTGKNAKYVAFVVDMVAKVELNVSVDIKE